MRSADEWFEAYGESHQHPTNKKVHWICVPIIFTTLVGLLWTIQIPVPFDGSNGTLPWTEFSNLGSILLVFALIYYAMISLSLAVGMLIVALLSIGGVLLLKSLAMSMALSLTQVCLIVFVLAWIGQFIGHKIEGKKPSFLEDIQFLMIGPLWLLGFIYRRLGIRY
mgnify:CR=1 FL=1